MAEPHDHEHENVSPPSLERGHEPIQVRGYGVGLFGIGLLALAVFGLAVVYGLVRYLLATDAPRQTPVSPFTQVRPVPPLPHIEPNQAYEQQRQRLRLSDVLDSYDWIDERQGIARIPIERAMDILAESDLEFPASSRRARRSQESDRNQEGRARGSSRSEREDTP